MQISSISDIAPSSVEWPKTPRQSNPTSTLSSLAASQTPSTLSAATSAPARVPSFSTELQAATSSAAVAKSAAPYAATVGGKSYPGSVEEMAGVYVASVTDPPGGSASGATVQIAENNLQIKLDELA